MGLDGYGTEIMGNVAGARDSMMRAAGKAWVSCVGHDRHALGRRGWLQWFQVDMGGTKRRMEIVQSTWGLPEDVTELRGGMARGQRRQGWTRCAGMEGCSMDETRAQVVIAVG